MVVVTCADLPAVVTNKPNLTCGVVLEVSSQLSKLFLISYWLIAGSLLSDWSVIFLEQ